jgi:Co/Zn/Cd efflux system component
MDPVMGIVGSLVVARWSWGLLRDSGRILLDRQAPAPLHERIREAIESDADNVVADLHVWSIGPGLQAAIVSVVTHDPRPPNHYKALLPAGLDHVTVEVQPCSHPHAACADGT